MKKEENTHEKQETDGYLVSELGNSNTVTSPQAGNESLVMLPNGLVTFTIWLFGVGTVSLALILVWTILRGDELLFAPFGLFLVILFAILTRQTIATKKYTRIRFDTDDFVVIVGRKQKTTRLRYDQISTVHEGRSNMITDDFVSTTNYIEVTDRKGTSVRIDDDTFNLSEFKKELQRRILLTVTNGPDKSKT